jgi:DAK2 domain fusion protein YloV
MARRLNGSGEGMSPPAKELSLIMTLSSCGADLMRHLIVAGARWVALNKEELNDLNVFPVPDGDTGTNLYLTMRSLVSHLRGVKPDASLGALLTKAARGCLLGARGNSGVIFSQIFGGFARSLKSLDEATSADFALALESSAKAAYEAVSEPREGTILTVIRETAERAPSIAGESPELLPFLKGIFTVSQATLRECYTRLDVLREAGVVDAGGLGLVYFLEGMLKCAQQKALLAQRSAPAGAIHASGAGQGEFYTYCTEFLLRTGQGVEQELRGRLRRMGDCVMVVQEEDIVKIHIHTDDPEKVRAAVTEAGDIMEEKIENMKAQHSHLLELSSRADEEREPLSALLSVCQGDGLEEFFRNACCGIIPGGQSLNPSVEEILASITATRAGGVILFPNNANCFEACRLAGELSSGRVEIIPTRNPAEAVALSGYYDPFLSIDENRELLMRKKSGVTSFEITRAVRDARVNGISVAEGQWMLLSGGEVVLSDDDLAPVLVALTRTRQQESVKSCYLIAGSEFPQEEKETVRRLTASAFPGADIFFLSGGQPHYPLLAALERKV